MAEILIRGMEMPDRRTVELMRTELACVSRECDRHCENCDLVQDRDELIVAFREAIRVLEAVANAVPIPEGHGRCIDADKRSGYEAERGGREWIMTKILASWRILLSRVPRCRRD